MPSSSSRQPASIPAHLRRYVVEQDYEQYTEIDHAVWRFVLLQTHARLQHTAHPAYQTGLAAAGIRVDRIPRIEEMNEKLSRFGWGAVCVDGFIPPRAFQAFQANRILPIAAEIRSARHLAYTPAPDIIHEAAGHAPILCEPAYARFIEQFGRIAEKAFTLPADRAVYEAMYRLSEVKERPSSAPKQIEAAHNALEIALGEVREVSEASRIARLYWWTAEYGLIGRPHDYRLYGAGLLSSLGEGHSCHAAEVKKLPLSAECVEFDYDITRAQPQLFVARDFEHLLDVLDEVSATLAVRSGGPRALEIALKSAELATLTLDSGLEVAGVVTRVEHVHDAPALIQLSGSPALFQDGRPLDAPLCPNEYVLVLGALEDGRPLSALTPEVLRGSLRSGTLRLTLQSGLKLGGSVREVRMQAERIDLLVLEDFELTRADGSVFVARGPYPLALAGSLREVCAGAPSAYFAASELSSVRVPRPRWFPASERRLLALYEEAVQSWNLHRGPELLRCFERIARELETEHPDEWLLRWNLLESLVKDSAWSPLTRQLVEQLEALEVKFAYREPIATGLAFIRDLGKEDKPAA